MDWITLLGLLAGSLTTIAFLPQVLKTWKTKSTEDISALMFITFCLGLFLWLIYGLLIRSLPIILANAVTLMFSSIILYFKFRFQ
jgi:MtN3 and saliva related transmembrane protein